MGEHIGAVTDRLINQTSRPTHAPQPSLDFWRQFHADLQAAKTPEAKDAVLQRYAAAHAHYANPKPNRRQRRGATLEPVQFRPLDRNQRARIIFLAERLDANTHQPGKHGGCLRRTALQVLRVLLFHFHNVRSGRIDPSLTAIAEKAGMARSTVVEALKRLAAAGIVEIIRRARWVSDFGRKRCVQWTNAYRLNVPTVFRQTEGDYSKPATASKSENWRGTTAEEERKSMPPMPDCVAAALERLGKAMAERLETENRQMREAMTPA